MGGQAAAPWELENEEIDGRKMVSALLDEDSVVQNKVTGVPEKFTPNDLSMNLLLPLQQ
jgi:hypothetical protein